MEKYLRVSPPIDINTALGVLHTEEYHNHAQRNACVKCSRKDIIVSHPPSEVEAANAVVEGEASENP